MSDEKPPEESPIPTEKLPKDEAPKDDAAGSAGAQSPSPGTGLGPSPTSVEPGEAKVLVSKAHLKSLYLDRMRLTAIRDRPRRALTTEDLDRKANALAVDNEPDEWEGNGPGMFIQVKCGHLKGLEAIYFRGTLGLRCRACKKLALRVKVAAGPPPDDDDEFKGESP